jgi:hypothetical protein
MGAWTMECWKSVFKWLKSPSPHNTTKPLCLAATKYQWVAPNATKVVPKAYTKYSGYLSTIREGHPQLFEAIETEAIATEGGRVLRRAEKSYLRRGQNKIKEIKDSKCFNEKSSPMKKIASAQPYTHLGHSVETADLNSGS